MVCGILYGIINCTSFMFCTVFKEGKSYISTQKVTKTATDVNGNAITHHLSTPTTRIFMFRKQ